jgi:hypothetical protein
VTWAYKRIDDYFMQDDATALTAYYSNNILREMFEDRLLICIMWLVGSPDLNPCNFYFWENLKNSQTCVSIYKRLDIYE